MNGRLNDSTHSTDVPMQNRAARAKDVYHYPQGKKRLEPVGVLIFAAIMSIASVQVVLQSAQRIVEGVTTGSPHPIVFDKTVEIVAIFTVVSKFVLGGLCRLVHKKTGSSSVRAYGIDHWNDVASNMVGIAGMITSARVPKLWWMDPTAAIAISLFILLRWVSEGHHHIDHIVGKAAGTSLSPPTHPPTHSFIHPHPPTHLSTQTTQQSSTHSNSPIIHPLRTPNPKETRVPRPKPPPFHPRTGHHTHPPTYLPTHLPAPINRPTNPKKTSLPSPQPPPIHFGTGHHTGLSLWGKGASRGGCSHTRTYGNQGGA